MGISVRESGEVLSNIEWHGVTFGDMGWQCQCEIVLSGFTKIRPHRVKGPRGKIKLGDKIFWITWIEYQSLPRTTFWNSLTGILPTYFSKCIKHELTLGIIFIFACFASFHLNGAIGNTSWLVSSADLFSYNSWFIEQQHLHWQTETEKITAIYTSALYLPGLYFLRFISCLISSV